MTLTAAQKCAVIRYLRGGLSVKPIMEDVDEVGQDDNDDTWNAVRAFLDKVDEVLAGLIPKEGE